MSNVIHTTPVSAANVLLHGKLTQDLEKVEFPYTLYSNVLMKPEIVDEVEEKIGAPFHLLRTDTVYCTDEYIRSICGRIL